MQRNTGIPIGFTPDEWDQAIASGRMIVVATAPQRRRLPRLILAPIQFALWTIRARIGSGEVPANDLCGVCAQDRPRTH